MPTRSRKHPAPSEQERPHPASHYSHPLAYVRSLCDSNRLPSSALALLVLMSAHANREGIAWPSQLTLAEEMGLVDRQVRRLQDDLIAAGLIEAVPSRGPRRWLIKFNILRWWDQPLPPSDASPDMTPDMRPDTNVRHEANPRSPKGEEERSFSLPPQGTPPGRASPRPSASPSIMPSSESTLAPSDSDAVGVVEEFRAAYRKHVDAEFLFVTPIPPTEIQAAKSMLQMADRERISKVIMYSVTNRQKRSWNGWTGWAGVVKSTRLLADRFALLDGEARLSPEEHSRRRSQALDEVARKRRLEAEEAERDRERALANPDPEIRRKREETRRRLGIRR